MLVDPLPRNVLAFEPGRREHEGLAPHRDERALVDPRSRVNGPADPDQSVAVDEGIDAEPKRERRAADPDVVDERLAEEM